MCLKWYVGGGGICLKWCCGGGRVELRGVVEEGHVMFGMVCMRRERLSLEWCVGGGECYVWNGVL